MVVGLMLNTLSYCKPAIAAVTGLLLAGCATVAPPEYRGNVQWCYEHLQSAAHGEAGPGNERAFYRPDEQPWFVIRRLPADFDPSDLSVAALSEWRVRVVDDSRRELAARQQRTMGRVLPASQECLLELAEATPIERWQSYVEDARGYDLYRDWQRWLGLYPVTSAVVSWRIRSAQQRWREAYGGPFSQPAITWSADTQSAPTPQVAGWLAAAYQSSALGLPRLTADQLAHLFAVHAPEVEVLQQTAADLLGSVQVEAGEVVFSAEPSVVYFKPMYTRYRGEYLLQLSYTLWFEQRPKSWFLDIYGGRWNGVTWRVTLGTDGEPLWYDSMHNCGCYHQVWLSHEHQPRADIGREEPLFLPYDWLGRPRLTLDSGTHHVRRVVTADAPSDRAQAAHQHYRLEPYDTLLQLPGEEGFHSLFDDTGMLPASVRRERLLLWPFGVRSPGAMRRLGTHTIAFVGKRHFDSPTLFAELIEPAGSEGAEPPREPCERDSISC